MAQVEALSHVFEGGVHILKSSRTGSLYRKQPTFGEGSLFLGHSSLWPSGSQWFHSSAISLVVPGMPWALSIWRRLGCRWLGKLFRCLECIKMILTGSPSGNKHNSWCQVLHSNYILLFFLICKALRTVKWNLQTLSLGLCCLRIVSVSALNDVEGWRSGSTDRAILFWVSHFFFNVAIFRMRFGRVAASAYYQWVIKFLPCIQVVFYKQINILYQTTFPTSFLNPLPKVLAMSIASCPWSLSLRNTPSWIRKTFFIST